MLSYKLKFQLKCWIRKSKLDRGSVPSNASNLLLLHFLQIKLQKNRRRYSRSTGIFQKNHSLSHLITFLKLLSLNFCPILMNIRIFSQIHKYIQWMVKATAMVIWGYVELLYFSSHIGIHDKFFSYIL